MLHTYEEKFSYFTTDYERDNPITKKDSLIREKKMQLSKEQDPTKI